MSRGILKTMLDMLTSGYSRVDVRNAKKDLPMETNIGKLFSTFAYGLEIIDGESEKIRLWDDLDNAQGMVLDRYGENFGVQRSGSSDAFYRLLIKVKMISLLSGGDIDTVVKAAASLFGVPTEEIDLKEVFPAKVFIYIDEELLDELRIETADIIAKMLKRIVAAGVGMQLVFRTYRTYSSSVFLNTGACEHAEITLRPADCDRTFSQALYCNNAAYEFAEITIRPAN